MTSTQIYFGAYSSDRCPTQEQAMYDDEPKDEMTVEEMDAIQKKVVDFEERHGLNPFWTLDPYWEAVWEAERC